MKAKLYVRHTGESLVYRVPLDAVLDTFLRPEDREGRENWYCHSDEDEEGNQVLHLTGSSRPAEIYYDADGNEVPESVRQQRKAEERLTTRKVAREIAREVVREALGADAIAKPEER